MKCARGNPNVGMTATADVKNRSGRIHELRKTVTAIAKRQSIRRKREHHIKRRNEIHRRVECIKVIRDEIYVVSEDVGEDN